MERVTLSWSIENWITITLMVLILGLVYFFGASWISSKLPNVRTSLIPAPTLKSA